MTALATKPVRIYEEDHAPLRLIAEIEGRGAAEVVHAALAEYLQNHRDVLAAAFAEAQDAVAGGDIAALAAIAGRSSKRRAQAAVQRHEAL
jgi:hypothetical protein